MKRKYKSIEYFDRKALNEHLASALGRLRHCNEEVKSCKDKDINRWNELGVSWNREVEGVREELVILDALDAHIRDVVAHMTVSEAPLHHSDVARCAGMPEAKNG